MMPKRTGYEVLAMLRGDPALAGLKVILLSARVQESDVERGIDAGADAYLAKPFKASELVAKVQELLGGLTSSVLPRAAGSGSRTRAPSRSEQTQVPRA